MNGAVSATAMPTLLRVAIPYGTLNGAQMRQLAMIADRWDKGLWPFHHAAEYPVQLAEAGGCARHARGVADVGMHRDPDIRQHDPQRDGGSFSGRRRGRGDGPPPGGRAVRQWVDRHPEFQFLPRKFQVAVTGQPADRAVTAAHDIGLRLVAKETGVGVKVLVGGGLGRTR